MARRTAPARRPLCSTARRRRPAKSGPSMPTGPGYGSTQKCPPNRLAELFPAPKNEFRALSRRRHELFPARNPRSSAGGGCTLRKAKPRARRLPDCDLDRTLCCDPRGNVLVARHLLRADAAARPAGQRAPRTRVHRAARLRARIVFRIAAGQRHSRRYLRRADTRALSELAPPAFAASRELEQSRPARFRRRHLLGLPHRRGISRDAALAAFLLSAAPASRDCSC